MTRRPMPSRGSRLGALIGAGLCWLLMFGAVYALWLVTI